MYKPVLPRQKKSTLSAYAWECLARVDADPLAVAGVLGVPEDEAGRHLAAARARLNAPLSPPAATDVPAAGRAQMLPFLSRPDLPAHCYRRLGM